VPTGNVHGSLHCAIERRARSGKGRGGGRLRARSFFPNRRPVNCLPLLPRDSPPPAGFRGPFRHTRRCRRRRRRRRRRGTRQDARGQRDGGGGRPSLCGECHTCCQRIPRQIDFRPRRAPRPSTRPPSPIPLPLPPRSHPSSTRKRSSLLSSSSPPIPRPERLRATGRAMLNVRRLLYY